MQQLHDVDSGILRQQNRQGDWFSHQPLVVKELTYRHPNVIAADGALRLEQKVGRRVKSIRRQAPPVGKVEPDAHEVSSPPSDPVPITAHELLLGATSGALRCTGDDLHLLGVGSLEWAGHHPDRLHRPARAGSCGAIGMDKCATAGRQVADAAAPGTRCAVGIRDLGKWPIATTARARYEDDGGSGPSLGLIDIGPALISLLDAGDLVGPDESVAAAKPQQASGLHMLRPLAGEENIQIVPDRTRGAAERDRVAEVVSRRDEEIVPSGDGMRT